MILLPAQCSMLRVRKAGRARAVHGAWQTEARSIASPTRRVLVRRVGERTARTRDRVNWRCSSASLGPSAPGGRLLFIRPLYMFKDTSDRNFCDSRVTQFTTIKTHIKLIDHTCRPRVYNDYKFASFLDQTRQAAGEVNFSQCNGTQTIRAPATRI